MRIVSENRSRAGMAAALLLLAVMAIALCCPARPADAANARIVSGIVKSVSATEIVVDGRAYDISGVPMRTGRLKPVPPAELAPGTKVDLHFHRGRLTLVYVYPNLVE